MLGPDTLTLAVSQSGETIDTLEAARHARRQGSQVIAVTNTVASSLAREADGVLYTHAGPEIGVASTKTFATQMVAQQLVALYLAQVRGAMFPEEIAGVLGELDALPDQVAETVALDPQVRAIAEAFVDARDYLFIGRHTGYPAALEGALKLKELSYIHASGYPAGELKHGPIALVDEGVPVVAIATRCHVYPKMVSNIQEVKARGAAVIAVVSAGDTEAAEPRGSRDRGARDTGAAFAGRRDRAVAAARVSRGGVARSRRGSPAEPREVRHGGVAHVGRIARLLIAAAIAVPLMGSAAGAASTCACLPIGAKEIVHEADAIIAGRIENELTLDATHSRDIVKVQGVYRGNVPTSTIYVDTDLGPAGGQSCAVLYPVGSLVDPMVLQKLPTGSYVIDQCAIAVMPHLRALLGQARPPPLAGLSPSPDEAPSRSRSPRPRRCRG